MSIKGFIEGNRQTGSTITLVKAVMDTNGWLVVGNLNNKHAICRNHPNLNKENIITINQIKNGVMRGKSPRAVFFDATALLQLVNEQNEEVPPLTIVKIDSDTNPTVQDLERWRDIFENAKSDKDFKVFIREAIEIEDDGSIIIKSKNQLNLNAQEHKHQINIKLTEDDVKKLEEINQDFFEGEATNSMLGRVILRKGMAVYKKLKNLL